MFFYWNLIKGDFAAAWSTLLQYIEYLALSGNPEMSLAGLKSFQVYIAFAYLLNADYYDLLCFIPGGSSWSCTCSGTIN